MWDGSSLPFMLVTVTMVMTITMAITVVIAIMPVSLHALTISSLHNIHYASIPSIHTDPVELVIAISNNEGV